MNAFTPAIAGRIVTLILLLLGLAGCAPDIGDISIGDGEPGTPLSVAVAVDKNQTTIQGVLLDIRPSGAGDFNEVGSLSGTGGQYTGQTPRLPPGDYDARVRVLYKAVFQSAVKTKSRTATFSLNWPPGTFGFESGGLNGWTYAGVFGASDSFQHCADEVLAASPYYSLSTAGWPLGINATGGPFVSGSLRVLSGSTCYPDSADEIGSTGFWNFNLVSPNLLDNPDWQGISGVSFRAITNNPYAIQAIATVVYVDENGNNQVTSPTVSGDLDFTEFGGQQWVTIDKTWNIPDRPIHSIELRFFGLPESLAGFPGSTVLVDVVSPIP